jgi:uncharacterized protein YecT (DUF1311 family)
MIKPVALVAIFMAAIGAASPCSNGTTIDMQVCWSKRNAAASAELKTAYSEAIAHLRSSPRQATELEASQAAWLTVRAKTCSFQYQLYSGGSIAPQLFIECNETASRTRAAELSTFAKRTAHASERPVSQVAAVRLSRMVRLYNERLNPPQRAQLAASQRAWMGYRDAWCALAGGTCETRLTEDRVNQLESTWVGETFWS